MSSKTCETNLNASFVPTETATANEEAIKWRMNYCEKQPKTVFTANDLELAFMSGARWMLDQLYSAGGNL